jgi:hypothetical protein
VTQSVQAKRAFSGDVPVNLRCGFCGELVQGNFYRARNRFVCQGCAQQVNQMIDRNAISPASFIVAAVAGLLAAAAGGTGWAVSVHVTHANIGFIAWGIGYLVGKTVHFASGNRRGVVLQWLATILALVGTAAGIVGLACWSIVDRLQTDEMDITVKGVWNILLRNGRVFADPFDLLWIGIAAFAAWRMCSPMKISMAGPFAYQPLATPLQFHTVEPLNDNPAATPPGNP